MTGEHGILERVRGHMIRFLDGVEDAAYVGIGLLLSGVGLILLVVNIKLFIVAVMETATTGVGGGSSIGRVIELLDGILIVLVVIELLYTVQVAYREHTLVAEPFIVIALISAVRRILVLTASLSKIPDEIYFRHAIIELGLLTVMVLVLVGSLIALQKQARHEALVVGESSTKG